MKRILLTLALAATLSAELPTGIQAKFIKIIAGNAVACKSIALTSDLKASGVAVDSSAKFAYAANETELASMIRGRCLFAHTERRNL